MFCVNCGNAISDGAVVCVKCGVPTSVATQASRDAKNRTTYILLGVFLGGLGVHNFYAERTSRAVGQLLVTVLTGWLIVPLLAVCIWAIVDVCTIKTDGKGIAMA